MVGSASLAEEAQKFVHDIRDLPQPRGWHHQLEIEPGLVIYYERKWRVLRAAVTLCQRHDLLSQPDIPVRLRLIP